MIRNQAQWRSVPVTLAAHAGRFTRFGVVGGIGAIVNMSILYLLVRYGGWNHMVAAAVATEVAILSNFAMNDRWTFHDAQQDKGWVSRVAHYNAIALGGALISLAVLAVLTFGLGMHYLVANVVAIGAGTIWNYVINSRVTWNLKHLTEHLPHAHHEHVDHVDAKVISVPD